MFRFPLVRVQRILRKPKVCALRFTSSHSAESDEQFDNRYEAYFAKDGMDAWAIRKGINDIVGQDLIPEPKIIVAALKACRRVNDFAVAIRFLEAIKNKCGSRVDEIYPYIIQEIRPTLTELGINTPEELGFDKPQLAVQNVYEMH